MSQELTAHLAKPIRSAKILDKYLDGTGTELSSRGETDSGANSGQIPTQDLDTQKAAFSQTNQALKGVAAKLNEFYDKVFAEHKEEIAKLAVEIARKVLVQKVENGDYEIESIVKEALKNAPTREDLVVHLNPEDLKRYQKAQQDEPDDGSAGIKFVPDPNIGQAECLLESPKGIIESLINEHLEQIGKALQKVK
jgi:flagellar assembly protein FliH